MRTLVIYGLATHHPPPRTCPVANPAYGDPSALSTRNSASQTVSNSGVSHLLAEAKPNELEQLEHWTVTDRWCSVCSFTGRKDVEFLPPNSTSSKPKRHGRPFARPRIRCIRIASGCGVHSAPMQEGLCLCPQKHVFPGLFGPNFAFFWIRGNY